MLAASDAPSTSSPGPAAADDDDRVFLVQHRWWKEAQDGAGIDAHGVPYASTPAGGPTSYGMKVLSLIMNDYTAAFTLRKADDLAIQPEAPAKAGARSYALVAADLFDKARAW